jgi:ATP-dependent exoDNAse (exonuclease V) beta subunit
VALESVRAALEGQDGAVVPINSEWINQVLATARAQPDRMKNDAADFGTAAHVLIEQIIQGLEPPVPPEMETVVENFTAWRDGAGLDIHLTEQMVFSGKYQYAGAMDAVAYRNGQMVVIDWKTSNGLYREYALQVAAYAKALEEMTGEKVAEAWAVRFGKARPEFEARQVADLDSAFIAFRAALYLWKAMRGNVFLE